MKPLLVLVVPIALAFGDSAPARAQRVTIAIAPPQAYIATTEPEYFEGHPVYWYDGNWYFRDHGRWHYYRREPEYLRERRGRWVQPRGDEWRAHEAWRAHEREERREHRYRGGDWNRRYRYER